MLTRIYHKIHRFRKIFSSAEWSVRMLGMPKAVLESDGVGLVLIQIDGFSRNQFERALKSGKMPFLKKLIRQEEYGLHTLYSGLPSSTPAVQGELFFGIKQVVPAFLFRSRESGKIVRMLEHEAAATIEKKLSGFNDGILKGGSAYCDIYGGGAAESHFCPATLGWGDLYKNTRPLAFHLVLLLHCWIFVKTALLMVIEFFLALLDFFRGLIKGQNLIKELQFIPSRVGICILLRELITLGASLDIARGLSIIHLNYLGYDEQAHRRGPHSAFAHWTLKGIDLAISRVWKSAKRSHNRHYDVWIYSDHGQEETSSFTEKTGKTVQKSINDLFASHISSSLERGQRVCEPLPLTKAHWLGAPILTNMFTTGKNQEDSPFNIIVTAQGPVGHVYTPFNLEIDEKEKFAQEMVEKCQIPLVMIAQPNEKAKAWTAQGEFDLPEQADEILGSDHPFLNEVSEDLVKLVHHPDSGVFVISGWNPNAKAMTFPIESGSHAGPGREETRAFALLPPDTTLSASSRNYLRPLDLHCCIKKVLTPGNRSNDNGKNNGTNKNSFIRVMTYNVHSCIGMDGRLSPRRIAKVIATYDPDIIALQELDAGRSRTEKIDQAHRIARELEMEFHFHPAIKIEEEEYGDAILSRFPSQLVKTGMYPAIPKIQGLEPRGALWVEISVNGKKIQLINTHIGLRISERQIQINHLLGNEWLSHLTCKPPIIICGDFNTTPLSPLYRKLATHWQDVQTCNHNGRPQNTWFPHYPVGRIDHIFASQEIRVLRTNVPRTTLTKLASDHLPLIADLDLGSVMK